MYVSRNSLVPSLLFHTGHGKMPYILDVLPVSPIPDTCNASVPKVLFFSFLLHSHALTSGTIYAAYVSYMCKEPLYTGSFPPFLSVVLT